MFQKMANEGHYRKEGGTRQGIYVCSPDGTLLSSVNSLNPDVVLETVKEGLDKWKFLPRSNRHLPDGFSPSISHRWEDSYPEDGLVLKGAKADLLSDPPRFSDRGDRWNMDHVWFNKDEVNLWLPEKYKIGEIHQCPKILKDRLFRFHIVNNVRGQTLPFASEEIKSSDLSVKVIEVDDKEMKIKITGSSNAVAKGPWLLGENIWTPKHELDHEITSTILGKATYDLIEKEFLIFELVALCKWRGMTENNGRKFGPDSGRIGILYNIANDSDINRIAPTFIDQYNAAWVKRYQ
tara:strand:- start:3398 stop:4276 length:879 start_codon:yes stop_codon:yes gene_type:complete